MKSILPLLIFALFFSCKKSENGKILKIDHFQNSEYTNSFPTYLVEPANSENPHDSIGFIHNQGIHYVLNNITNLSSNEVLEKTANFFEIYYPGSDWSHIKDSISSVNSKGLIFNWQNGFSENRFQEVLDSLVNTNTISLQFIDFYSDIIDISETLTNKDNLANLISNLKSTEAQILQCNSLTGHEKFTLLGMASVARYSAAFWTSIAGSQSYVLMSPNFEDNFPIWRDSNFLFNVYDGKDGWDENKTCEADFGGWAMGMGTGWLGGPVVWLGSALAGMVTASLLDIYFQWKHNVHFPSNPSDPLGVELTPKIGFELLNPNSIEIRYFTIIRPNYISIFNSNNEEVFTINQNIPNFEKIVDISNLDNGNYTIRVVTNLGTFEKVFIK